MKKSYSVTVDVVVNASDADEAEGLVVNELAGWPFENAEVRKGMDETVCVECGHRTCDGHQDPALRPDTNARLCECEHEKHFPHTPTGAEPIAHGYQGALAEVTIHTECGVFHVCRPCAKGCRS